MAHKRFPTSVFDAGSEPDARFTLANERTFLAWLRTSLAFIAGGVALEALALQVHPTARLIASLVLLASGGAAAIFAWINWKKTERAIREGRKLPASVMMLPMVIIIVIVIIILAVGTVV